MPRPSLRLPSCSVDRAHPGTGVDRPKPLLGSVDSCGTALHNPHNMAPRQPEISQENGALQTPSPLLPPGDRDRECSSRPEFTTIGRRGSNNQTQQVGAMGDQSPPYVTIRSRRPADGFSRYSGAGGGVETVRRARSVVRHAPCAVRHVRRASWARLWARHGVCRPSCSQRSVSCRTESIPHPQQPMTPAGSIIT